MRANTGQEASSQWQGKRSILEEGNLMQPAVYKPLLKQVLEDIFDPNVSEAPQLDYHSGGLSNMLKAGFG
ncbi:hypothetical protein HPB51_026153 [Rhipicephalus microplus]|uniref:Uncharacterized protein n=1 Tax=Rhipicephalus microplus TaxID=6941 RepID=A0A9J6EJS3_RHIMP|nr:hypothetical protein HPB51_026153 [Rhipicephalus microplus]